MTANGTAKITTTPDGFFLVEFRRDTSFLIGTQVFGAASAAFRFCRERNLRVVECR